MNAFGFFMRRLVWQFGVRTERRCWVSVTRETQILSEAQDLLGRLCWRKSDKIEDLTGEFWQLKDLDDQQEKLRVQSDEMLERIELLKEQLEGVEDKYEDQVDVERNRKEEVLTEATAITREMDDLREEDAFTRQKFSSLKLKLDVLKRQEGVDLSNEMTKTRAAIHQLKLDHDAMRKILEEKELLVQTIEASVQGVDGMIAALRAQMREESSGLVEEIGILSKRVAEISAKIGTLENSKAELSFHVGIYLSQNSDSPDPEIQKVLAACRPIIAKINVLRRSIQYNQRLARRSGIKAV